MPDQPKIIAPAEAIPDASGIVRTAWRLLPSGHALAIQQDATDRYWWSMWKRDRTLQVAAGSSSYGRYEEAYKGAKVFLLKQRDHIPSAY